MLLTLSGLFVFATPGDIIFQDYANDTLANLWGGNSSNFTYQSGYIVYDGSASLRRIFNNTNGLANVTVINMTFFLNDSGATISNGHEFRIGMGNGTGNNGNTNYILGIESGICNQGQSQYVALKDGPDCPVTTNNKTRSRTVHKFSVIINQSNKTAYYYANDTMFASLAYTAPWSQGPLYVTFQAGSNSAYRIGNITVCDTWCNTSTPASPATEVFQNVTAALLFTDNGLLYCSDNSLLNLKRT